MPPGFGAEQEWINFKADASKFLHNTGLSELNGELDAHGSMNPNTDLDMLYRVDEKVFNELVADYKNKVSNIPSRHIDEINQGRMSFGILGSRSWGRFDDGSGSFFVEFYDNWLNN